jgi:hypothetical protein
MTLLSVTEWGCRHSAKDPRLYTGSSRTKRPPSIEGHVSLARGTGVPYNLLEATQALLLPKTVLVQRQGSQGSGSYD